MQDTRNQNAISLQSVKHNIPAALHATQTRANLVTRPPQCRVIGEHLAAGLKVVNIANGLSFAPGAERIVRCAQQIGFGTTRETNQSHRLAQWSRRAESLPDTCKHIVLGNTAGVAFIDGLT